MYQTIEILRRSAIKKAAGFVPAAFLNCEAYLSASAFLALAGAFLAAGFLAAGLAVLAAAFLAGALASSLVAGDAGKKAVIAASGNVGTGQEFGTALAHDDFPSVYKLGAVAFNT